MEQEKKLNTVAKEILLWLVDTRNHKPTFKIFTLKYTPDEHAHALSIIEKVLMLDIVCKFYDVEGSFVAYTKIQLDKLADMLGIELE